MANLKDYLEQSMDLKRACTIRFRDVNGAVSEIRAHIVDIEEVSGRQIIETDAGFTIGLDQIIAVDDRSQDNYC